MKKKIIGIIFTILIILISPFLVKETYSKYVINVSKKVASIDYTVSNMLVSYVNINTNKTIKDKTIYNLRDNTDTKNKITAFFKDNTLTETTINGQKITKPNKIDGYTFKEADYSDLYNVVLKYSDYYTISCEDWVIDKDNNRKIKLGTKESKEYLYNTTAKGSDWGTENYLRSDGVKLELYKKDTQIDKVTKNDIVYRYYYLWTDLNIFYANGPQHGGTISYSVDGKNFKDAENETEDFFEPYGTTYYFKNLRPKNSYEELKDKFVYLGDENKKEELTYDSTNGYYKYTVTHPNIWIDFQLKYIDYKISVDYNGGSGTNPSTYTYASSDITLNNPSTRTGYVFTGYTGTGLSSVTKPVKIPTHSAGNRSYKANWQAKSVTTYFHPNGGKGTDGQAQVFTYDVSGQKFGKKNFSRTGYSQGNWAESASGSGIYSIESGVVNGWIEEKYNNTNHRVDLYAKWTPITYSIGYNLNGGSISGQKTSYTIETASFTLPTPTRTGYTFTGWTGTGLSSASKSVTVAKGSTGNRSYTANWSINTYTATFNGNGGSNGSSIKKNYGSQLGTLPGTSRTGYTFACWYTASSGGSKISNTTTMPAYNPTYYAHWTPNKYTVDVNPIIQGTAYNTGKAGFTFSVYLNGNKVATNVTDWCQTVNYGTKVRVVANGVSGYAMENNDETKTVGTSAVYFNPKWFKYSQTPLTGYFQDGSVSYSFNTATGLYSVRQRKGTPGWGEGALQDNSNRYTSWGQTYVLHFEVKTSVTKNLRVDPNANPDGYPCNDYFSAVTFEVNGAKTTYSMDTYGVYSGVTYNGMQIKSLKEYVINKTLNANTWYSINLYVPNNSYMNPSHKNNRNYTAFGFNCTNDSSDFTYQIRNVYSYIK